jgi:hypothetical protein
LSESLSDFLRVNATIFVTVKQPECVDEVEVLVAKQHLSVQLRVFVLLDKMLEQAQEHEVLALLFPLGFFSGFLFFAETLLLSFHASLNLCALMSRFLDCILAVLLLLRVKWLLST